MKKPEKILAYMKIIKCEVYLHKYEDYVAFLHTFENGNLMLEYTLEPEGQAPCYVKKSIKKLDKAFQYICDVDDYDKKTKGPKKI
jgi:hypothetical protein